MEEHSILILELGDGNLDKLISMLKSASETVPFYIDYFKSNNLNPLKIESYPIIEKQDIMLRSHDFLNSKIGVELKRYKTSGSTGIPLNVYKSDADKYMQLKCLWKYRIQHFGVSPNIHRITFHFFKKNKKMNRQDIIIKGNTISINALNLTEEKLLSCVKEISRFNPEFIMGTPTMVCQLLHCYNNLQLDFLKRIKYVELMGEYLFKDQQEFIKNTLNCNISNHYGCTEIYGIAQQCSLGHMHVLSDNVLLEIDKNNQVIVTGLNSFAMPFIRYRLGDKACIKKIECSCGETSDCVEIKAGRISENVVLSDGKLINSAVFYYIIETINRIETMVLRFKVVQKDFGYLKVYLCVKVQADQNYIKKVFENELKKNDMGDFDVKFEFIGFNDFDILSSKYSYFENKMEGK